jgi:hypothetical protein
LQYIRTHYLIYRPAQTWQSEDSEQQKLRPHGSLPIAGPHL